MRQRQLRPAPGHGRLRLALGRSANWMQLAKFAAVGASGYVVNLAVFSTLVVGFDVNYLIAAMCSFLVAVTNNYAWNRIWTFRRQRGSLVHQGAKFLAVSTVALAANLVVPPPARRRGPGGGSRAGDRHRRRDPVELRGQQALELPARLIGRVALALVALALAAPCVAAAQVAPAYDADGNLIQTPFVPQGQNGERLTEETAIETALANPKIADWIARYEGEKLTKQATFKEEQRYWQVKVWVPGKAGQIVEAKVDDASGQVKDPWTGPQVAWGMARGVKGAFGADINNPLVWFAFCALFFIGLADWRRFFSIRTVDLLVLLSFTVSLAFFNRGEVFRAMPLIYPPLLYLVGRLLWITWKGKPTSDFASRSGRSGCSSARPCSRSASASG